MFGESPERKKGKEGEARYLQELDDVAGSEDSVRNGELERIGGGEIGGQDALLDAAAAEDLAGGARRDHHHRRRRRRRRRLRGRLGLGRRGRRGRGRRDRNVGCGFEFVVHLDFSERNK